MTLQDFFNLLGENPNYVLWYFAMIPVAALLLGFIAQGEGHISPWKYLYSALIFLVCIPGIFAVTLNIYLFLFERNKRSILESDILSQILPVASMIMTLFIIGRNTHFSAIPGFEKISGLMTMVTATFAFMWFLDRTHIVVFSYIPFWQAILVFVVLFLIIRLTWSRMFKATPPPQY
jgi:hypothetical protein